MRETFYKIIGNDDNGYKCEIYGQDGVLIHTQPTEPLPTMRDATEWVTTKWTDCTALVVGAEAHHG